jgi:hypothetical protein
MSVSHYVRSQLDDLLTSGDVMTPDQVAYKCSMLMSDLIHILERTICDEIKHYACQHNLAITLDIDSLTFSLNGIVYVIRVLEDPRDNFVLWVTLTPNTLAGPKARMICCETELGDSGPYRRLRVLTDKRLSQPASQLLLLAKEALAAGSQAIEAYAMKQLTAYRDDFVEQLYLLLARPFRPDIRKYLYLYVICPGAGGGIVMDSFARLQSLSKLREASYSLPQSPVELLCRVLEARFPFEQCVAREIVPAMRTYECSPLSIPSAARVGIIQRVLFDNGHMVLQPLVCSDNVWVEAAYPAILRGIVEKTLLQELDSFRSVVKNFEAHSFLTPRDSKNKDEVTQKIGSWMGSLIGSFLKYYE